MGYMGIASKILKSVFGFCTKSKPMVRSTITDKTKYLLRQSKDIRLFGQKNIERTGVSTELLDSITPFRRLAQKKATLSDPKYFIKKYEKETGENFLPTTWNKMNEAEKVDYIVHRRYSRLVSNKIMDKIKNEDVEHLYSLDKDGEIIGYLKGQQGHVEQNGNISKVKTTIHNHPMLWTEDAEFKAAGSPKVRDAHSCGDVGNAISLNVDSYVVDWQGNKFLFEPAQKFNEGVKNREQIASLAHIYVNIEGDSDSIANLINSKLQTSKTIKEFAAFKFDKMKGVFDRQIAEIQSLAEKGWCKFTQNLSQI